MVPNINNNKQTLEPFFESGYLGEGVGLFFARYNGRKKLNDSFDNECDFCKTYVPRFATVCTGCGAEREQWVEEASEIPSKPFRFFKFIFLTILYFMVSETIIIIMQVEFEIDETLAILAATAMLVIAPYIAFSQSRGKPGSPAYEYLVCGDWKR